MDGGDGVTFWEWVGGLVFVAVTGLFGFTHKRIGEVQTSLKEDQVEEITSLRNELARMETMVEQRFKESKDDRAEMWRIIVANQAAQEKQHAQNLERLNKIPTRDEMMALLQQFAARRTTH